MKRGIKSWVLMVPIIISVFTVQVGLIVSSGVISRLSNELSFETTKASNCTSEITSLQAGSSILSETSTAFVYMPYIEKTGQVNAEPLISYATEISNAARRPNTVLANLKAQGVDNDIYAIMSEAAGYVNEMMKTQYHAIALVRSEYDINMTILEAIPKYELTDAEKALSKDEKLEKAFELLHSSDYTGKKRDISRIIGISYDTIKAKAAAKEADLNSQVKICRGLNWGFTTVIFFLLLAFFAIIIVFVLVPLYHSIKLIENDELMPIRGLYENRVFAKTYNELRNKKQIYEKHLEESVETDALTGLKSRYSLNQIFQQPVGPTSVALFVFDVNYLKQTNDSLGHDVGDQLIVKASNCILKAFNVNDSFLAYRFGGDEFIVILKDILKTDIEKILEDFKNEQSINNVSIACGYAYEDDGKDTSYSQLFKRADRNMYTNKESEHSK